MTSDGSAPSVFRNRNVQVYFYITTLLLVIWSFCLGSTFDAYLFELARSRGRPDPNTYVGSVESVRGLVALVLALPLGWLADNINRRKMLRMSTLPGTAGVIALTLGISQDNDALLYCGVIISALFMQVFMSCGNAFLADCVPNDRLTAVMTVQGSLYLLGFSVGPLAQMVLIACIGNTWNLQQLHVFLCSGFLLWPLIIPAFFLFEKTPAEEKELQRSLSPSGSESIALNAGSEEDQWKSEKFFGLRKKWLVPIMIEICSLITATGAGMTVKFFPLFFKEDYHFTPIALNGLSASYTVSLAIFVQICRKASVYIGRIQASFLWQIGGTIALLGLWKAQPLSLVIVLHILRGSFMNACGPINGAIVMDCVESKYRGRWSAVQSISRFTWSGSAILGGYIADSHDYRYAFFVTAVIYAIATVLFIPLLFIMPKDKRGSRSPDLTPPAAVGGEPGGSVVAVSSDLRDGPEENLECHNASVISLEPVGESINTSPLKAASVSLTREQASL